METNNKDNNYTVAMVALGCPKNIVDSETMLGKLGQAGFIITPNADNADIVIVNTCGFIAPAKEEAIEEIKYVLQRKKQGDVQKVIVAGCLAERLGAKLNKEVRGIDAIVGLPKRDQIVEIVNNCLASPKSGKYLGGDKGFVSDDRDRLQITPPHWAYLRISEGCNRRCSFCTIPNIRGPFRSKPMESILHEANDLVANGCRELDIIAQDSNYYGKDLSIKDGLSDLLKELEKIENLDWIRVMYLYPATVSDRLIETIANSKKVLNYVDIPIQHINNDILKAMKRSDTRENTINLIEKLRSAMPDVVLRTTAIVGFPGETQEQFDELLDFVKWAKFDAFGCFPYFAEAATPAAELPDQLPDDVKHERVEQIMLAQQEIVFEKNKQLIGKEFDVLVDGADEHGNLIGRYYGQAPHIDSVCYIENSDASSGEFIKAKVTDFEEYDLVVDQI